MMCLCSNNYYDFQITRNIKTLSICCYNAVDLVCAHDVTVYYQVIGNRKCTQYMCTSTASQINTSKRNIQIRQCYNNNDKKSLV